MPAIETRELTKLYGSERGIEDVTIAVEAGEVFGFLGPNGAGKTTTIRTPASTTSAERRSWRRASAPTSTGRSASSRVATGRRSG